ILIFRGEEGLGVRVGAQALKYLNLMVIAATLAFAANCKKPAAETLAVPGDAKSAMTAGLKLMADSVPLLEKASDGASAAAIVNKIVAFSAAAEAKFPELKELDKHPELKAESEKYGEDAMKFLMAVATVSEKFKDSAELKAAGDKLVQVEK
ncbi:MAG TPA: hypothetical protein PLY93_15385, partial [Turneriella sp.]|nr:hypothetical protein [Turneriella sp.]